MAYPSNLSILDAMNDITDIHSAIFLTYGADLAFFEEAILPPLWREGCRNILVFMDGQRYGDTTGDLKGSIHWAGRRYVVLPIDQGARQAFHPKMFLLLGHSKGRLIIGSGNLTFNGIGHNQEVFTCLDWNLDASAYSGIFHEAWGLVKQINDRWGHSSDANRMLLKATYEAEWLSNSGPDQADIHLLHNFDHALIRQCETHLKDHKVKRLTIISPFLDNTARALRELGKRFHPDETRLVLQEDRTVGDIKAINRLVKDGFPITSYPAKKTNRYLHAKVYLFETDKGAFSFTGSANCTQAAWSHPATRGNLEIGLLRKTGNPSHFSPLLSGAITNKPVSSLEDIHLRARQDEDIDRPGSTLRLYDVTLSSGSATLSFCLKEWPATAKTLKLRLSTTPPILIDLGKVPPGLQEITCDVPSEWIEYFDRPRTASIWGAKRSGMDFDLNCNEVWITQSDVLRFEVRTMLPSFTQSGKRLAEMMLANDDEWTELYETIVDLVELDVVNLKRRGGAYTATPKKRKVREIPGEGEETTVRLIAKPEEGEEEDDIARTLFVESTLASWLDYLRSTMPGAKPEEKTDTEPDDRPQKPTRTDKPVREIVPPSEWIGRRFIKLVRKYIISLHNVEYMCAVSVFHVLTYYVLFQKITYLLLKQKVIDQEQYCRFVQEINGGFLGDLEDKPPALEPCLCRHIQRALEKDWLTQEVHLHSLASMFVSQRCLREIQDQELEEINRKNIFQNLSALAVAVRPHRWFESLDALNNVAVAFELAPQELKERSIQLLHRYKLGISEKLSRWEGQATIALVEQSADIEDDALRFARIEYGLAHYDMACVMKNIDVQIEACSELVWAYETTNDHEAASKWGDLLVQLLLSKGESKETVTTLNRLGRELIQLNRHREAASKLRQAVALAKKIGDESLIRTSQTFLDLANFMIR